MGNGVSPAGTGPRGTHSLFWCCAADSDGQSLVGITTTDETITASSSQVSPKWVATTRQECNGIQQIPYYDVDAKTEVKASNGELDGKAASNDDDAEATTADSATPARLTPPSPSKDSPADFGGSWLCMSVTGDMEAFLKDMGLSEGPRRAASVARYGALRQVQNIVQSADSFVVENILDKPVTMRFVVGEGVQKTSDQEGKSILIEPVWDGDVLCVVSKRETGELIANSRRYIDGADMILELRSPSGTVVRRKFQRRLILPG